jgi:hypothetical protein
VERAVEHELEIMGSRFLRLSPVEAVKIFDVIIPCLNRLFGLFHLHRLGRAADRRPANLAEGT